VVTDNKDPTSNLASSGCIGNENPVWNGGEIQKIWRIPVPEARNGVCCACGRG